MKCSYSEEEMMIELLSPTTITGVLDQTPLTWVQSSLRKLPNGQEGTHS